MVVISKILPLVAAGVGIFFLVNAITRPAHAQQTASALSSTFGSLGSAGSAIAGLGQGIGSGLAGLFQPVWEVSNLFERFSTLATGSANVSPVVQVTTGETSAATVTLSSGSDSATVTSTPSTSGGADLSSLGSQTASGGGFGAAN
mgnify:CR=1 FL=1|tara:strand:+ start:529 stop:966 length:438 start_codon:yes stop_codon:yes gene_type:complete